MYANGYKYWLAYRKGSSGYYRCSRYKNNCPGRCTLNEDGLMQNSTPHNHPPEEDRIAVDRFRKVLSQRAANETTDLHAIYLEEATRRHADASLLYSFLQAESCMRKARRRKPFLLVPCDIEELGGFLKSSELFRIHCGSNMDAFYQTTVRAQDAIGLVLWHQRTMVALGTIDNLFIDCSLEIRRSGLSNCRVLLGSTIFQGRCVPVIYAIMSAKTHDLCTKIFAYLKEQLREHMVPTSILTEPDDMMHNVLEESFPEAAVKVYWHHYMAAVLECRKKLNMMDETNKGYMNSAFRMLLVLPLLPSDYLHKGLQALIKWMNQKNILTENMRTLCNYVANVWLANIGYKRLSMFDQTLGNSSLVQTHLNNLRCKNDQEKYTVLQMLEHLTQVATKQYVIINKNIKRIADIGRSKKVRRKANLVHEEAIINAKELWYDMPQQLKDPLQFLQVCSHCITSAILADKSVAPELSKNSLSIPMSTQINGQSSPALYCDRISLVSNIIPTVEAEPPPLVFFSKLRRIQSTELCRKQMGPPPLVPLITNKN
ncbi:uncharacterized protein LOC134220289 [Armigeres subalbatus]|uniref:uncharacterized protein LOC134220289 n=1 Tax=Armigeres subalbatus TaxID=124917 RepID=UPI002ED2CCC9